MEFTGFVIANQNEEFIHSVKISGLLQSIVWSSVLDLALSFKTEHEAKEVINFIENDKYQFFILAFYQNDSKMCLQSLDSQPVPSFFKQNP